MKRLITLFAATALTGTAAHAVTDIADIDTDNDDFASYEEMVAVYPGLTQLEFAEIDINGDNRLESPELYELEAQEIVSRYEDAPRLRINVDSDGDGFASYEEMTAVFPGITQTDFAEMDMNGDNRLSQFEIYDLESQEILMRQPTMESIADVEQLDIDGDQFLSYMEMRVGFPGIEETEFSEIDTNGDNRVNFTELYAPEAQEIVSRYQG